MDRRFFLDARSAPIAGAVCRRLDGIPLAIELAAARTATLGMEGLAARLDDRFRLLTGGHRTALPRHQTLRATLDWSYELLPAIERTVLHRLAVFAGGFTLEAASAVATAADLGAPEVVDSITNLAAKSLVVVEAARRGHALPAARDDAGLRAREAHRERRARPGRPPPRRVLPGSLRAGRDRVGGALHRRVAGRLCPRDRQHADRRWTGPSPRAATRRSAWRSPPRRCRCGSSSRSCSSVAAAPSARSPSLGPRPERDARREMQLCAALGVSLMQTKGPAPDTIAAWTTAPRDRRAARRHRVSAPGALGPVAFPRQPRRMPRGAGAGGALLRAGGPCRQSGGSARRRADGRRLAALPGRPAERAAAPRSHARTATSPRRAGRTPSAFSTTSRWWRA